ncbi:acyltransferase [Alicyclobacillus macrosporangiidus]|uniref:acyltransferase n=1 Tax=Alicyclobacillus macrosporangiidus TaxID=392015 RepID=UPI000692571E|nr:acyltransferase [Alicyclobacillus macrosporangiidus]
MGGKRHLYEIDLMRAIIILGVVCVHVISFFNTFETPLSVRNLALDAAMSVLHFTREAFLFITGLVLFVNYYRRPFSAKSFWKKRFTLIVIPYLFWNAAYVLYTGTYFQNFDWSPVGLLRTYGKAVLTGDEYFMYFLVISMQLYLVFPLLIDGLRRWRRGHVAVLAASFGLQLALMAINKLYLQPLDPAQVPAWIRWLFVYRDRFLLTYQFWFVAGALLAIHYEQVKSFVLRHPRWLYTALAAGLAVLVGHYLIDRLWLGEPEETAVMVLQPIMVPYSLLVTITLWYLGLRWAMVRKEARVRRLTQAVTFFGGASFGVFLIHPFALHVMDDAVATLQASPSVRLWLLPAGILFVYLTSAGIAYAIGRVPWLGYVVGKKTKPVRSAAGSLSHVAR